MSLTISELHQGPSTFFFLFFLTPKKEFSVTSVFFVLQGLLILSFVVLLVVALTRADASQGHLCISLAAIS